MRMEGGGPRRVPGATNNITTTQQLLSNERPPSATYPGHRHRRPEWTVCVI